MDDKTKQNIKSYLIEWVATVSPYLLLFFMLLLIAKYSINWIIDKNTGELINIPTEETITPVESDKNQTLEIEWPITISNDIFDITKYPKIHINKKIDGWFIEFNLEPYGWIIDKSEYLKSDNFMFAFRFFFDDISRWWYYQVFRNEKWWVGNDTDYNLMWAVSGSSFRDGNTWVIPISDKVLFAKDKGQYWFKQENVLNYFNSNIWKTVHIGWFTSSVKEEPNWWKINKINSITIKYIGEEGAIELIK